MEEKLEKPAVCRHPPLEKLGQAVEKKVALGRPNSKPACNSKGKIHY